MNEIINGLSVFIEGNTKNKSIMFVHGFPYDHTMWKAQIDELSENYFCVAYDIRGLGESPVGDGQYTMESFVDDLETIITKLKIDKPVLCGLSMGGYIGLRAMERMQEKFSAVILCDTRSDADNNEGKQKRAAAIKRINTEGLSPFAKDFVTNCYGDFYKQNHKEEFEKRIAKSSSFNPVGVKGSLLAMLGRNDTTEYLGKIKIPALILCGEFDSLTPPPIMKAMADKINGAEFVIIKNSGHMSPIENPEEVNGTIKNFLLKNRL
ncbi:MAG: alpha/beta hydrolase [Ignavibacteriaceae bacterium]|nr:alpha/beta hydrolase [Ignavibacterium sp.]MCC6254171.1 alpha/beta hydrolase [Ignavibacteriaceae bacterium]HMN22996.1 alpha/beta hydrolase [Ignavibacteriaceae bacterium]HRP92339.1 alpha/beta hydrolase [Ignavibacteriaceae bacterium]HRQ52802.1 alpha/beta hydrolase [Ignavibacteriaceae bacterium]